MKKATKKSLKQRILRFFRRMARAEPVGENRSLGLKKSGSMPKPNAPTGFGFSNAARDNDPNQLHEPPGK